MNIGKLEVQNYENLPSQAVINPNENVSAMVLRSSKEVQYSFPRKEKAEKRMKMMRKKFLRIRVR